MRKIPLFLLSAAVLLTTLLCSCKRKHVLSVGSKDFTEQVVLGEIVSQHLEHRLNQKVSRKLNMGGTLLVHQALTNGEIDVYPEYTGTAMSAVLKLNMVHDAATIRERVREVYRTTFAVEWLDPLGFNDSFAMIIRKSDADAMGLATLSDATKMKDGWTLGEGYEFQERPDGFAMLNGSYNLPMKRAPVTMNLGLLYKALEQKQVNMIAGNTTDGLLDASKVQMLVDDRKAFPPYEACLLVRTAAFTQYPGLQAALNELSGKFSDEVMRQLNREVDLNHTAVPQVAANFLKQAGLAQ